MSKRVSNNKTGDTRRIKGRQRVKLGWRKKLVANFKYEMERRRRMAEAGVVEVQT